MKKYFKYFLGAILVGSILAFFFYKDIQKEVIALDTNEDYVNVFQVGVFKNEENAKSMAQSYSLGTIYKDQDYFRVFIGVTINNSSKLEEYFTELGYNFYLKKVRISDEIFQKIKTYDEVLGKSNKAKTISILLKEMNALFLESQT